MMNSMERVVTALKHKEPDRVPVYPVLGGCTRSYVGATYEEWATNADVCAEAFLKCREDLDLDCIVTLIDLSVECTAWGQELIFPENEAAHPNYKNCVVKEPEDYEKIKKVDYRTCERMMMHIDVCKKIVEKANGEFPVVAFVFGPLGTLSMLRNQAELYVDCVAPTTAALGTDEEWEKECKKNIDEMAAGGGFILATGCEYPANASFDHARQMVEIAKTYGVYKK